MERVRGLLRVRQGAWCLRREQGFRLERGVHEGGRCPDAFRQELVAVPGYAEKYRQYLSHFSQLEAVRGSNKEQFRSYLEAPAEGFDYRQLLFIQYMERNSYYHGGEVAKAGSDYGYRERQLSFYIAFLTELVAMLGAALFSKEKDI